MGRVDDPHVEVAARLGPGESFVVSRGVHHDPIVDEEVRMLRIETVTTAHTGSVVVEGTRSIEAQLAPQGIGMPAAVGLAILRCSAVLDH